MSTSIVNHAQIEKHVDKFLAILAENLPEIFLSLSEMENLLYRTYFFFSSERVEPFVLCRLLKDSEYRVSSVSCLDRILSVGCPNNRALRRHVELQSSWLIRSRI